LIVAVTTLAELGDLSRFDSADKLMAFLGLVPGQYSSGETVKKRGITKTGNTHVRKVLVEAAWAYRLPARLSRTLRDRQRNVIDTVRQTSWKAQLRLCARFRQMAGRRKLRQIIIVAIARELSAFIWEIANQVPVKSAQGIAL
jgi:transposase